MTSQCHINAQEVPTADPVLDAAGASILDVGLRRTTLADVARRAAVSRMTIYRQWGDLDAIVAALLTRELVGVMRSAAEAHPEHTARERLARTAPSVVAGISGHPIYRRILDLDPELLLPLMVDRLGSTQRAAVDIVATQIKAGRRDGSIPAGLPARRLATIVVISLQSLVFSVRVLEAERVRSGLDAEVRRLIEGWLGTT